MVVTLCSPATYYEQRSQRGHSATPRNRLVEAGIVPPVVQWCPMERMTRRSMKEWLLAPEARTETLAPERVQANRRPPPDLDQSPSFGLESRDGGQSQVAAPIRPVPR